MQQKKKSQKVKSSNDRTTSYPDLSVEKTLYEKNYNFIAGVDEAGRGPLAGPVVAAAVILPKDCELKGLNDSKKLSPKRREFFFESINNCAVSIGVGIIGHEEIDRINILNATFRAMEMAVSKLEKQPDHILIDGRDGIETEISQRSIIRGDGKSLSIAAASVIAKVTRDRMMCEFEKKYTQFSFSRHKGYGTKIHIQEIQKFGPSPIHRKTFLGNILR